MRTWCALGLEKYSTGKGKGILARGNRTCVRARSGDCGSCQDGASWGRDAPVQSTLGYGVEAGTLFCARGHQPELRSAGSDDG